VHNVTHGADNINLPILVLLRVFFVELSADTRQTCSRDVMTLTFDLLGHRTCRWCGLSYFIRISSLKFVGLPTLKMLLIFDHSVKRPGDLDLWPWTGSECQQWHALPCCQFWCFCDFALSRYGEKKHASDWRHDLITLTFDFWRHRASRWRRLSYSILISSLKLVCLSIPKIWRIFRFSINRPSDLDLWSFDL